jgi:hypothetical protein
MTVDSRLFSDYTSFSLKNDWFEFKSVLGKWQCSQSQVCVEEQDESPLKSEGERFIQPVKNASFHAKFKWLLPYKSLYCGKVKVGLGTLNLSHV